MITFEQLLGIFQFPLIHVDTEEARFAISTATIEIRPISYRAAKALSQGTNMVSEILRHSCTKRRIEDLAPDTFLCKRRSS